MPFEGERYARGAGRINDNPHLRAPAGPRAWSSDHTTFALTAYIVRRRTQSSPGSMRKRSRDRRRNAEHTRAEGKQRRAGRSMHQTHSGAG